VSDRQGADTRRDATSAQFVCLCCPGADALDQVIEVRALEGQSAVAERVEAPSSGDSRSEALSISRLLTYLRVVGSYLRL